jgi:hypothetical protein
MRVQTLGKDFGVDLVDFHFSGHHFFNDAFHGVDDLGSTAVIEREDRRQALAACGSSDRFAKLPLNPRRHFVEPADCLKLDTPFSQIFRVIP